MVLKVKKLFFLLTAAILLFGCISGSNPENSNETNSSIPTVPAQNGLEGEGGGTEPEASIEVEGDENRRVPEGSPLWEGTYSAHIYGGGKELSYDDTLTATEELYFDEEENAFDVLRGTYTCKVSRSSHIEMGEGFPPITSTTTGTGSITKDYAEDEYRLWFENDGSVIGDFREPNEDWVRLTITLNGGSKTEDGGCLIDDFHDILFESGEYEDLVIDAEGRDSVRGTKKFTYGSANGEVTFEYHRVEA